MRKLGYIFRTAIYYNQLVCALFYLLPLLDDRGNFNIWNTNEGVEGLMAHMSNLACQKVYDEACQLPVVLELEIRPKSDVWPKSFEKSDPSGEHIALYFFPSEIRSLLSFLIIFS